MKKLLLANLILLAAGSCFTMEQDFGSGKEEIEELEKSKVPTLKQLAAQVIAQQGLEKIDSYNPPEDVKELIMQQVSSLPDIMEFITSNTKTESRLLSAIQESMGRVTPVQEEIRKDLLKKIPPLFFNALLNSQIKLSDFIGWINSLPSEIRQSITATFADQIHTYMTRETIDFIEGGQHHLPIEFESIIDVSTGKTKLYPILFGKGIRIHNPYTSIMSPDYLVPIFIGQQLQLLLIDELKNNVPLIDATFQKKINAVLSEMKQHINLYGEKYPTLKIYFDRLKNLFLNLPNIQAISETSYAWDEKEQLHVKK